MGLFKRRPTSEGAGAGDRIIAAELIPGLPSIGQAVFAGSGQSPDVSPFYLPGFLKAGMPTDDPAWSAFVDRFIGELDAAAQRLDGWALAGAFHIARDFVKSDDWAKPALIALMDRALAFLHTAAVDSSRIPMFALTRWNELRPH